MYYICSWRVAWKRSTINEAPAENRRHTDILYPEIKRWLELLAKTIALGCISRKIAGESITGYWQSAFFKQSGSVQNLGERTSPAHAPEVPIAVPSGLTIGELGVNDPRHL